MVNHFDRSAVIVGIDASDESLRAVTTAARQAHALGVPLRIVHAVLSPGYGPLADSGDRDARARVEQMLAAASELAHTEVPDLDVRTAVVAGTDASALLAEAERAGMLVVGHRGVGTMTGMLTGAIGMQLAGRTACPMLIVRGESNPAGPVVVGVEVDPTNTVVLDAAFRQARAAGCPLRAVHAWHLAGHVFTGASGVYGAELIREAESEAVRGTVERARVAHPDIEVSTEIRHGRPVGTLTEAAAGASMLVVGSRGAGGFRGLLLGSVAMGATQHAPCPVLIVPSCRATERVPQPRAEVFGTLGPGRLRPVGLY